MNYKISLFIFLLFLVPSVIASTPNFNFIDNMEDELNIGQNDAGNLVLTATTYTPNIYNLNLYNPINIQQYDIIRWTGNNTATITSPSSTQTVLTFNTTYQLNQVGNYILSSLTNSSLSTTVTASLADFNLVNIQKTSVPNGFAIELSDTNFIIQNEKVVSVDIEVDDDVSPNNYSFVYKINNLTKTHIFEVLEKQDWAIVNETINETIHAKVGDNFYLGNYIIENRGNVDLEIKTSKTGNQTHILSAPQPFTLYKKTNARIDLQIQIPTTFKPGTYDIGLKIFSDKKNQTFPLRIIITDAILPTIDAINFSTDKAYKENLISIIAKDNNEVKNVTLKYDNKVVLFDKDQQLFTKKITFDKLSRYVLEFCATDNDLNKKCVTLNKTFVKSGAIQDYKNTLTLPTKKVGKYSEIQIFNLTENIPEGITVELYDFVPVGKTTNNDSYIVRIIDGDGSVKTLNKYDTDTIITKKGLIKLEIRSEEVADFSGVLRFTIPQYVEEVSDLNFKVSFKDYDIPEDFTKKWLDNRNIECNVVDTGDLSSSYYDCNLEFPIDTRPEDISVPTTVKEREKFESEASTVQDELDSKKKQFSIFTVIFSVLIIILILAFYYAVYVYPYVRNTIGHKLKEDYDGGKIK